MTDMTFNLFMLNAIYIGMLVFSAVALAVFITYLILNRNNNYGDFAPGIDEYSSRGIVYKRLRDEVTTFEKNHLFADYGENPYENKEHKIPEQLLKNSKTCTRE